MQEVIVKPMNVQYVADNMLLILLLLISILSSGYDDKIVRLASTSIAVLIVIIMICRWWSLKAIRWTVTKEQIIYQRGVLNREKDYIELYRVFDFKENQSLIQQLFGTKTIVISSGDKSHPALSMFGISSKSNIVDIIRERVEVNKQIKRVYEISNR